MSNEKGKIVIDDMILTKEQAMSYFGMSLIYSSGLQNERFRWPNGILPYSFDPMYPFSPYQKVAILHWISEFNKEFHGCLKIV